MTMRHDLQEAARVLNSAQLVAVSSGAGMSKESGIATFREAQTGLWARYDPEELATAGAFRRNPDMVWQWYMYRFGLVSDVKPNAGHLALAELEDMVPEFVVLTQNIDGLHAVAGNTDVVELHGSIYRFKCYAACLGEPTVIDLSTIDYDTEHAPHCPHCGDLIRPDIVWFGEMLPERAIDRAFTVAAQCDVMVVVGTSGIVQPAASLPYQAKRYGAAVIEVNPVRSEITPIADIFLKGPAGEVLPALVDELKGLRSGTLDGSF